MSSVLLSRAFSLISSDNATQELNGISIVALSKKIWIGPLYPLTEKTRRSPDYSSVLPSRTISLISSDKATQKLNGISLVALSKVDPCILWQKDKAIKVSFVLDKSTEDISVDRLVLLTRNWNYMPLSPWLYTSLASWLYAIPSPPCVLKPCHLDSSIIEKHSTNKFNKIERHTLIFSDLQTFAPLTDGIRFYHLCRADSF